MAVFVTDGEQRATLAVVRALGSPGIPVTVGSAAPNSLAGSSRFCQGRVKYPSAAKQSGAFQEELLQEMRSGKYDILIPMTDITTTLVAQMHRDLEEFVRVPISSAEQIAQVQDKGEVLLRAQKIGIACPETVTVGDGNDLDTIATRLRYPVVIKPRLSWIYRDGIWMSSQVHYAYNPEDFKAKYQEVHALISNPLIQERIHGQGRGVFLLLWNGELKAAFCHRRLREKPPWGGVSVLRDSIPFDWDIVNKSYRLLQAVDWQGPAMVEFKLDDRDG